MRSQDWEREGVDFEMVEERARALAAEGYEAADRESLPGWMKDLSYDQYRAIEFDGSHALWEAEDMPFRAMFFHPGYIFLEPVKIHEFTDSHRQRVRFSEEFFNYGDLIKNKGEMPSEAGFAGFKLLGRLNDAEKFDELAVFQGASYWRALGKGQKYGISARGIAVDTGADGVTEEFPMFREFWLGKPEPGDERVVVYALMDGPSVTGAYEFRIRPGDDTQVDVRAVVFARKAMKRMGMAPMSSMFWFGENSRKRFDDFRPEVHDSDGLAVVNGEGERVWRPLANETGNLEFSFFTMGKCGSFGLLQRDRRFAAYEDGEAAYDKRPSLWIEPTSDWGAGSVMLMEIPTGNELADNVVAMWVPEKTVKAGDRYEISYRQHWTMEEDLPEAGGHVIATRTGKHEWQPEQRTMIVEFQGGKMMEEGGELPEGLVEVVGEKGGQVKIEGVTVQELESGIVRLAFQILPAEEGGRLADIGPVELRAVLKRGDDYLTETWVYRIAP